MKFYHGGNFAENIRWKF